MVSVEVETTEEYIERVCGAEMPPAFSCTLDEGHAGPHQVIAHGRVAKEW